MAVHLGNLEYECLKCRRVYSLVQQRSNGFCSECNSLLYPRRQPNCWVFQFSQEKYRWFDWILDHPEDEERWVVSRYTKNILAGDKVAVWSSGNKSGVYALSEILTNPEKKPLTKEQENYWIDKSEAQKFGYRYSVALKYLRIFVENPVLSEKCTINPDLKYMSVLIQPQGTNFTLTRHQWNTLLDLTE